MAVWSKPSFRGNPYVTITAINVSGGIEITRTSGVSPLFVQVSASNVTATGTTRPYEDLEYRWTCTESSPRIDAATGEIVDQQEQFGGEASFRLTGNDTITLYVRGADGSGGYETASTSQAVTVSEFSGTTYYVDADKADDSGDGLTEGNAKKTPQGALSVGTGDDVRLLLKRDQTHVLTSAIQLQNRTTFRAGAFGSGDDPILQGAGGSANVVLYNISNDSAFVDDHVWSDIVFDGADTTGRIVLMSGGGNVDTVRRFYFDNCTWRNGVLPAQFNANGDGTETADTFGQYGFWDCVLEASASGSGNGILTDKDFHWFMWVGGAVYGDGGDAVRDHHLYVKVLTHSHVANVAFFASVDRNYCVNFDTEVGVGEYAEFVTIRGCDCTGTIRGVDFSNNDNNPANYGVFRNVIVEECAFHDLTDNAVFYYNAEGITVRNCVMYENGQASGNAVIDSFRAESELRAYGNLLFLPSSAGSGGAFKMNSGNEEDYWIRNNTVLDRRSASTLADIEFTAAGGQSRVIDYNDWYTPNDTTTQFRDAGTAQSFAQWQAAGFDANGSLLSDGSEPDWPDPASGVFAATGFLAMSAGGSFLVLSN